MVQPRPLVFHSLEDFNKAWKEDQTIGWFWERNPDSISGAFDEFGHVSGPHYITNLLLPGKTYYQNVEMVPVDRAVELTESEKCRGVVAEYAANLSWSNDPVNELEDPEYRQKFPVEVYLVEIKENTDTAPPVTGVDTEKVLNIAEASPRNPQAGYANDYDGDGNPDTKFGYIYGTDDNGLTYTPKYALVVEFQKPQPQPMVQSRTGAN